MRTPAVHSLGCPNVRRVASMFCMMLLLLLSAPAAASCPKDAHGGLGVCVYQSAWFTPGIEALSWWGVDGTRRAGAGLRLSLYSWKDNSPGWSPSHGEWFATLGLYSRGDDAALPWSYALGGRLSFEGNASRRWLIPYYGGAVGRISQSAQPGRWTLRGDLGLYLWRSERVQLTLQSGYQHAPGDERWRGVVSGLGLNLTPW